MALGHTFCQFQYTIHQLPLINKSKVLIESVWSLLFVTIVLYVTYRRLSFRVLFLMYP